MTPPTADRVDERVAGEIALPPGWRVDTSTQRRLARLLATLPPHVAGVAAPRSTLPAGTSFRSESEHRSLSPTTWIAERPGGSVDGAVLARPGVEVHAGSDGVEVAAGPLVVDLGTLACDPQRVDHQLRPAVVNGRSPFPWRPVVVLLAVDALDAPDDVRRLANELLDAGVEARLALPAPLSGPLLTQPCTAEPRSIHVLRPDVIVTLDDGARARADEWCRGDRGTVIVDAAGTGDGIELVPWTIGRAAGRLRARIGLGVAGDALAPVLSRLMAGPHPVAPAIAEAPVEIPQPVPAGRSPRPATLRSVHLAHGVLDEAAARRVDGLARLVRRRGHRLGVGPADGLAGRADDSDLLIVHAVPLRDELRRLLDRRRAAGRVTIVDVSPRDLELEAPGPRWAELTAEGVELVTSAGAATTPSSAVRLTLDTLGVRNHRLPTLRTSLPVEDPSAGAAGVAENRIGWHLGSRPHPVPDHLDDVAAALATVLDGRPEIGVDVVGDAASLPSVIASRPGTRVLAGAPGGHRAGWLLQVWTPWLPYTEAVDALDPILAAGGAGLATVVLAANPAAAAGLTDPETTLVEDAGVERWTAQLLALVDEPEARRGAGRRTAARARLAADPSAADDALDELLAWAWP